MDELGEAFKELTIDNKKSKMMENEKTIEVLNKLVEINNDRVEVYETAANGINEHDVKILFSKFIQTSFLFKQELSNEIYKLGGIPTEGTKHTDKFICEWMDVKKSHAVNDFKAILSACKYVENQAINIYKNVLTDDLKHLRLSQQSMIRNQYFLIKSGRSTVKIMRHVLV